MVSHKGSLADGLQDASLIISGNPKRSHVCQIRMETGSMPSMKILTVIKTSSTMTRIATGFPTTWTTTTTGMASPPPKS